MHQNLNLKFHTKRANHQLFKFPQKSFQNNFLTQKKLYGLKANVVGKLGSQIWHHAWLQNARSDYGRGPIRRHKLCLTRITYTQTATWLASFFGTGAGSLSPGRSIIQMLMTLWSGLRVEPATFLYKWTVCDHSTHLHTLLTVSAEQLIQVCQTKRCQKFYTPTSLLSCKRTF